MNILIKNFFVCIKCIHLTKENSYGILFVGTEPLFKGKIMSFNDFKEEYEDNECMKLYEIFKTKKDNKFIYACDIEINQDYLIKVE